MGITLRCGYGRDARIDPSRGACYASAPMGFPEMDDAFVRPVWRAEGTVPGQPPSGHGWPRCPDTPAFTSS